MGHEAAVRAGFAPHTRRAGPPLPHLLLLPHDLQLLGQLDLALALSLLGCAAQLLPVLLPQGTECPPGVTDLRQLVLQPLVVHCGEGAERGPWQWLPS